MENAKYPFLDQVATIFSSINLIRLPCPMHVDPYQPAMCINWT